MTVEVVGRSVRGESHKRKGIECQDNFLIVDSRHIPRKKVKAYEGLPDGIELLAVADGHGSESSPFSKTGSSTAVNVFCELMAEYVIKFAKDGNMEDLFVALNKEGETTRIAKRIVKEWASRIGSYHSINPKREEYEKTPVKDIDQILKEYGTTLLGVLSTEAFIFAFQLGDGDITYIDKNGVSPVIEGDKILGVETHSISKPYSWSKTITKVISYESITDRPFAIILSSDGWINSHTSEQEFYKTCKAYYNLIDERGLNTIDSNLEEWLSETSRLGCGDDITVVIAYFE